MGVESPPADDVASRGRQRHLTTAGKQRAHQQDRGPDTRAESGVEIRGADVLGMDVEPIASAPFGPRTDRSDQLDEGFGIANARHILEGEGVLGQQRCGDDGKGCVLVAGGRNAALQAAPSFDDIADVFHVGPSIPLKLAG